jgi:DNA-binding Lrp family transcriptional regulator
MGEERQGDRTTPPGRKLSVSEAADELGISAEAVRSRLKRGTLRSIKSGTSVYVLLDPDQTATGRDQTIARTSPEHDQASDQTHNRPDPCEELVEELRDRVRYLEEESRRKDHLLAAALERIPAIEAPRDGPKTASEDADRGDCTPGPAGARRAPLVAV